MNEELVMEAFMDCKPYLTCWKEIEETVKTILKESSDIQDFMRILERLIERESNVLLRTDMKILLSELRSKLKRK
ncbi:MAG: hypothetical protein QXD66_06510 [Candidatus Nezhaarchaeales archaeon]|nr:MAG: hypothetical protein DSO06_05090 [Candidatus Nezhaarchaeota archaeon WYZ-LMO8]TDA36636.1 MAG: hypothetical protein DSO05_02860 [Candidatus Nezhaarchaeota archaeon WYZ-LMO7]